MKQVIQCLAQDLLSNINFKKGVAIARLDDEGRVLIQDDGVNEYRFAGLNDYDDSYFYIRHRSTGEITYGESSQKKFTGMQNFFRVEYQMRIVACMKNVDAYELESKIRFVLMNANLPMSASFANATISPVQSQIDSIQVLTEESKAPKIFDKNLIFVAHDFNVTADVDMALEFYCQNPCFNAGC
jgi:hypothetical protein